MANGRNYRFALAQARQIADPWGNSAYRGGRFGESKMFRCSPFLVVAAELSSYMK